MAVNRKKNGATCKGCGLCVSVCPMQILTLTNGGEPWTVSPIESRVAFCMGCGHCMAICPMESVSVEGLEYGEQICAAAGAAADAESFMNLLDSRRSVRVFKDQPVPRESLEKIVEAISKAPMGFTPHKIEVTVVSNRAAIERALPVMIDMYEKLAKMTANPIARFFIRKQLKPDAYSALMEHVLPSLKFRLPDMKAGKGDTITRGAPAMLLFHAKREAANHSEDAFIALTYGLLAAHAMGLGATAISLVPPVVERSPELRAMFRIPEGNEVCASMIVGYSKLRFVKSIRRELAGVTWI